MIHLRSVVTSTSFMYRFAHFSSAGPCSDEIFKPFVVNCHSVERVVLCRELAEADSFHGVGLSQGSFFKEQRDPCQRAATDRTWLGQPAPCASRRWRIRAGEAEASLKQAEGSVAAVKWPAELEATGVCGQKTIQRAP